MKAAGSDAQANNMAELLFAQLALILQRYRYATDNLAATQSERCSISCSPSWRAASIVPSFLIRFCEREGCSERALRQQFRQQTGMTINHYLRQLRICHAQYLLRIPNG